MDILDILSDQQSEGLSPKEHRALEELRRHLRPHTLRDDELEHDVRGRRLDMLIAAALLQIGDFSHETPEQLWETIAIASKMIALLEHERSRRAHAEAYYRRGDAHGASRANLVDRFAAARDVDCGALLHAITGESGRGTGRTRTFHCPLHEDKTPSLVTYPPGHGWYCFGCNRGGDAVTLLTAINPISRMDALRLLEGGAIGGITPRAVTPEMH